LCSGIDESVGLLAAVALLLLAVGTDGAFSPSLEVAHQHSVHEGKIVDVAYDHASDVTWSLDEGGTFVGYAVEEGEVAATHEFEQGHADDFVGGYDLAGDGWRFTHREHVFGVSSLGVEPTENVVVSTGGDNTVKFYDPAADAVVAEYAHADTIYAASIDRNNGLVWIADGENRDGVVTGLDIQADEATAETADEGASTEADPSEASPKTTEADRNTAAETTGDDGPGFGVVAALVALAAGAALARRR